MIVDGAIYHGASPGEAEIGHVRLDRDGTIVEHRCSGWAVDGRVRAAVAASPGGALARLVATSPGGEARHLAPALAVGDPLAARIVEETAGDLAFGLSHAMHLFHPDVIVLGGGLSGLGEPLRAAVAALLRAGVDVNDVTRPARSGGKLPRRGTSALLLAIENGHFELALDLLERGADAGDMRSGYTPLHVMVWVRKADRGEDEGFPEPRVTGPVNSVQLIRRLVAAGARVNDRLGGGPSGGGRIARKGATPFLLAADTADLEYMKLLLELGVDPRITNADGATALMAAAGLGTRAAGEEAGSEEEALAAVEFLLGIGADINAVTENGDTAMHGAAFANFPRMVHLLAKRGMRFDVWYTRNKRGWTPLLIAEGHRFGNFKPSFETMDAIKRELTAQGVTPPPPTPVTPVIGYGN